MTLTMKLDCEKRKKFLGVEEAKSVLKSFSIWFQGSPGLKVIKLFSCSAQLRLKFILLINV